MFFKNKFGRLVLVFQYFQPQWQNRQDEINYCVKKNLNCPFISNWIIFSENVSSLNHLINGQQNLDSIEVLPLQRRLEYLDFLTLAKDPNAVYILINSDIELVSGIHHFQKVRKKELWALSRWEGDSGPRMLGRESQDTWAVRGDNYLSCIPNLDDFKISLGLPGCENAFAGRLHQLGWKVKNFCYDIKTRHHHKTGLRSYSEFQRLPRPYYLPNPQKIPLWRYLQ